MEDEKKDTNAEESQPLSKEEAEPMAKPPDGGWGWVVVLGSFCCNVIVDGIIFSYGLLLPELAKDLGETKGRLAWVGSLLAGFYLIAGPLVSGLANTYGCRPVTIAGTLISAVSFALASVSPNLEFLCFTFGVVGGIGFGFIYLPAVVTVGFYFERRRAFATGLAVCGSGVGTFLMAPFVQYLLGRYDWRGCLLVLSGIVLHCAIFGALFRPLKYTSPADESPRPPLLQRIKHYRESVKNRWDSIESVPHISVSLPEIPLASEKLCSSSPTSSDDNSPPPSYSDVVGADEEESYRFFKPLCLSPSKTMPKRMDILRPFYRQDILYSASLLHLPEFKSNVNDYTSSITKIPPEETGNSGCCSPAMKDTFRQMLDISLLRSPTFLLLGAGGFLTLAGFFVPFVFVVDRAIQQGIPAEEATYILPVIGITNTVGRVFCGWASDIPSLNALTLNNIALITGGIVTILCPFLDSFSLLMTYAALFGFSIACFATLRSIIVVELLGLDKLTNAFGLLLLFQGIASIIGAPVAGMFYDITGSYDASFYIAGTLIFVSGLLGFPLPYIAQWEKRMQMKKHSLTHITINGPDINIESQEI